ERAWWLGKGEKAYIVRSGKALRSSEEEAAPAPMTLRSLLLTRTIWGLMITQGCAVYTNYLFLTFLPVYLSDTRGLEVFKAGWVTGITYGVAAVGSVCIAAVSDKVMHSRSSGAGMRRSFVIATLLLGLPLIALPQLSSLAILIILVSWVL